MNDNEKNIVIYCERWLDGGIEEIVSNIISKSNNNFKIIVSQKETEKYDKVLKEHNVELIILHDKIKNPIIRMIYNFKIFKKIIGKYNESIIHINVYNSLGLKYAQIASKMKCSKILIHAHNNGIDKNNDRFHVKRISNMLARKIYTSEKYSYISCSDEAAKFCFDINKIKKYTIVKNGIYSDKFIFDMDIRKMMREKMSLNDDTIVFGHVGRFVYQKNHEFLIDAFEKYTNFNKNTFLILIGDGPNKADIEKRVISKHLNDKVLFLGNVDNVNEYMQAFDCFLFPSQYEGLGIVAIEAQAAGLQCVVSDAVPKMVKITSGLEFVKLNLNDWYRALKQIKIKKRENTQKYIVSSKFDITNTVEQIDEVYEVIQNDKK